MLVVRSSQIPQFERFIRMKEPPTCYVRLLCGEQNLFLKILGLSFGVRDFSIMQSCPYLIDVFVFPR
jgi:hypothetical protein